MTTAARRCEACDINWPDLGRFEECSVCKAETTRILGVRPLTFLQAENVAQSRARERDEKQRLHDEFEAYYADREAKRLRDQIDALAGTEA